MNKKNAELLSRRQFTRRAALVSATASLAPVLLPADSSLPQAQSDSKLSPAGQAESDSRYQQLLALYGSRFTDEQKSNLKRMSDELQPTLEHIRSFHLENGNAPALYLKPLVEREKKAASAPAAPAAASKTHG